MSDEVIFYAIEAEHLERHLNPTRRNIRMAEGTVTVEDQLDVMTRLAARAHVQEFARKLTENELDAHGKMRAIIDDIHRRFVYAPDPTHAEFVGLLDMDRGGSMDVDDACVTVAAMALSVGIPCRLVLASYRHSCWTVRVAYEADGAWTVVDVLRQPWSDHLRFEQLIVGPAVGGLT
jgi:hypothetical protein